MNWNCKRFETVSARDLDNYIGKSDCIIIDLRDHMEYNSMHVTGAVNIPYDSFFGNAQNFEKILGQNNRKFKESTLVFYCERGGTSLKVARELSCFGYKTKTVVGGINAYKSISH